MKILIVEDDKSLRDLMQMHLSDYGTCDLAANGLQAVEAVARAIRSAAPYDLACMDVMMPEMDGLEAMQKIRRMEFKHFNDGLPGMKIIMITAKDMAKDMMSAYRSGCEAYLTKPFTHDQLIEQIRQLGLLDKPGQDDETDLPV
jgi:two-component system chemotaxis response regulator CheY